MVARIQIAELHDIMASHMSLTHVGSMLSGLKQSKAYRWNKDFAGTIDRLYEHHLRVHKCETPTKCST